MGFEKHSFNRRECAAFRHCLQPRRPRLPYKVYPEAASSLLKLTKPRNFTLEDVHVEGAERIAEAIAKYDIDRFVHVSSYNATKDSPSEFFRTKVLMPPTPSHQHSPHCLNRPAAKKSPAPSSPKRRSCGRRRSSASRTTCCTSSPAPPTC